MKHPLRDASAEPAEQLEAPIAGEEGASFEELAAQMVALAARAPIPIEKFAALLVRIAEAAGDGRYVRMANAAFHMPGGRPEIDDRIPLQRLGRLIGAATGLTVWAAAQQVAAELVKNPGWRREHSEHSFAQRISEKYRGKSIQETINRMDEASDGVASRGLPDFG